VEDQRPNKSVCWVRLRINDFLSCDAKAPKDPMEPRHASTTNKLWVIFGGNFVILDFENVIQPDRDSFNERNASDTRAQSP
jgi:hypothetical protein